MRTIVLLFFFVMTLSACRAPEAPPPNAPAPPEIDDVEPADGNVPGEEEIEVPAQPEDIEAPAPPEDMAGVPSLTDADYVMLPVAELNLKGTESPEGIGRLLRKRFGRVETGEGNYDQELEVFEDGANAVIVFTTDGLLDDSVKAEQRVVQVFFPAAVPAGVTGYGVRYKCYRGDTPDTWTKQPCP